MMLWTALRSAASFVWFEQVEEEVYQVNLNVAVRAAELLHKELGGWEGESGGFDDDDEDRGLEEAIDAFRAGAGILTSATDHATGAKAKLINALRGHLAEYGVVAAQGAVNVERLRETIDDREAELSPMVRDLGRMYLDQIDLCSDKIVALEKSIRVAAAKEKTTARLQTMPGIGPICALAIAAFAPPMESFRRGRDFAAWSGWHHGSNRPEANRSSARHRRWASAISAGCSSSAP